MTSPRTRKYARAVHVILLVALCVLVGPARAYYECNEELVSSSKLRASSQLNQERSPDKAVRDSGSSWTAGVSDFGQFLEVSKCERVDQLVNCVYL